MKGAGRRKGKGGGGGFVPSPKYEGEEGLKNIFFF